MTREYQLLKNYRIKLEDFEELLDFQGGLCPICDKKLDIAAKGIDKVCLDHNHETDEIRGIIHSRCNLAIGFFRDNPELSELPPGQDLLSKRNP